MCSKSIITVLLVTCALQQGCAQSPAANGHSEDMLISEKGYFSLTRTDTLVLQENLATLGFIYDIVLLPNGEIVIASGGTPPAVVRYDERGVQATILGSPGPGPNEYSSPNLMATYEENVVIFDGGSLKFMEYTPSGQLVREVTGFTEGIADFIVANGYLIQYRAGRKGDHYLGVYDAATATLVREFGHRSQEHDVLMMYAHSGEVAQKGPIMYYVSPAAPVVYRVDLRTWEQDSIQVSIPEFQVPAIDAATMDHAAIREYIFNVSRIRDVLPLDDYLIVQAEHGSWENRHTELVILEDGKVVDAILLGIELRERLGEAAVAGAGNSLYFLREISTDGGATLQRVLEKWTLQSRR